MTWVNPLAHVPAPIPQEQLIITMAGKDVPFRPLGTQALAILSERFPSLKARLSGEDVSLSEDDSEAFAAAVIALGVAPDGTTLEQLAEVEKATAGLVPLEREAALLAIMGATMPDHIAAGPDFQTAPMNSADLGATKTMPNRKTRRAAAKAS